MGSLSGILRIFSARIPSTQDHDDNNHLQSRASDLLLEVDLGLPIIEVAAGRLLSASPDSTFLLTLHPRKVSVYSVSGTAGLSEHGFSFNILLMYEHVLQRSAYDVVVGSFGQDIYRDNRVRDFICVQSLDGTLSFYEQESFAFSRFLPNFLLPGPIDYLPDSDSFIIASSRSVDSYRYQILAIAKDDSEDSRNQQTNIIPRSHSGLASSTKGRRLAADWTVVLGEDALDLKVVSSVDNKKSHVTSIVVLGERNLFLLKDNGTMILAQKFDFTPISFHSFLHEGNIMSLIATEFSSMLIYSFNCLKWAAQLPFLPISIKRAKVSGIRGVIVCLSDDGFLSCLYLGTNPSINPVTIQTDSNHIVDYTAAENELQSLRKVIRSFGDDMTVNPPSSSVTRITSSTSQPSLFPVSLVIKEDPVEEDDDGHTSFMTGYQVSISSDELVKNIKIMVDPPDSFKMDRRIFEFSKLTSDVREVIHFDVTRSEEEDNILPASLSLIINILCFVKGSNPRVNTMKHLLPLRTLFRILSPPRSPSSKEKPVKLNFVVVCNSNLRLGDVFSQDFTSNSGVLIYDANSSGTEILLEMKGVDINVVSLSNNSNKYKFTIRGSLFASVAFISVHLIRRMQSLPNVKFDSSEIDLQSLPFKEYFRIIESHIKVRQEFSAKQQLLSRFSLQFRAIQKRFLAKMKDRNPAPLNQLEDLMQYIHGKIMRTANDLTRLSSEGRILANSLTSTTDLFVNLISFGTGMKSEEILLLQALFPSFVPGLESLQGWQEMTVASLTDVLRRNQVDHQDQQQSMNSITSLGSGSNELSLPEKSDQLNSLIKRVIKDILKGNFNLSVVTTTMSPKTTATSGSPPLGGHNKTNFLAPSTEVIPEEEEEGENDLTEDHNTHRANGIFN